MIHPANVYEYRKTRGEKDAHVRDSLHRRAGRYIQSRYLAWDRGTPNPIVPVQGRSEEVALAGVVRE